MTLSWITRSHIPSYAPRMLRGQYLYATARGIYRFVPAIVGLVFLAIASCDTIEVPNSSATPTTEFLTPQEVRLIIGRAAKRAEAIGKAVTIAIVDRDGNVLGVFSMSGTTGSSGTSKTRARTAAFLSSNQHGFSTLTASFITRNHFPPGVQNTPAGPLFGVGFSSLPGGDIQPNGSALNDHPGGVPIFKNGQLVGGLGVSGGETGFDPILCTGRTANEIIALSAVEGGYAVLPSKRGDVILIDGIRFLFSNSESPPALDTSNYALLGTFDTLVTASLLSRFPFQGEVNLDSASHDFRIRAGTRLSESEVRRIISQAVQQAARTRAAIRRPIGSPARVFVSVVDLDGSILGIYRTPDATIFSYDVSAQKGRTALVFSNPANPLAQNNTEFSLRLRSILGLSASEPLAVTTRAIGFLAQDFFPPGIDRDSLGNPVEPGPLFEGPEFAFQARLLNAGLPSFGPNRGNGITIFPGGIPLYKGSELVGAIGVSGDGVDQDDLIASAGSAGFEPPQSFRCDQFFYRGVRLPYIKTPRHPEL